MCGIYGILNLRGGGSPEQSWIDAMANLTIHRDPDDSAIHVDGELAIGIRRLSVIDLAGGHQPITNLDDMISVICNGEIYNFRALRNDLKRRGYRFKTRSDSEVLLHLYEEYGENFVRHLDDMFAFALWDSKKRTLYVGRDRLGIKPLYYFHDGQRLAFAFELKALLALPFIARKVSPLALREDLGLGYVPAPHSMIQGLSKLPQSQANHSEAEWCERILEALDAAVRSQMISDVPLGAFLSGGIDSSAVERTIDLHEVRKEDYTDHLLSLMNLEIWSRLYVDEVDHQDLTAQPTDLAA